MESRERGYIGHGCWNDGPFGPLTVKTSPSKIAPSFPRRVGLAEQGGDVKKSLCLAAAVGVFGIAYAAPGNTSITGTIVLRGVDSQNARPFKLSRDSDVLWSCPGCSGSNFIFSTSQDIPVNALGPTRGRSFLERGRYTHVSISATGRWTITIKPTRPRPVRSRYVLTGVDSMNVKPFTLTHGSNLRWTCRRCRGSNFIISTDQDIPVNALGPTKGRSFLEKGRYTGVNISATGLWKIIIG
jgi:hypothetical protein